jgi:Serine dehydrogenase proteinase
LRSWGPRRAGIESRDDNLMSIDKNLSDFLDKLRAIEQQRGSRICCMIHKAAHICHSTKWWLRNERALAGRGDKIELLLYSPGGHPEIAFQMMKFLRGRFKTVNVIVPLGAKSAATLMCLGADTIFMGELAELGPIDIQLDDPVEQGGKSFSPLDEFKSMEYMRDLAIEWIDYYATVMLEQYEISIHEGLRDAVPLVSSLLNPIFEQIDPIEMGGNRRAIAISEEYAKRMLAISGNPHHNKIVRRMVWEYPSHDFCIDFDEARAIGLPVERLPEQQDLAICEALFDLERKEYHGFVSPPKPQHAQTDKKAKKAVRQQRAVNSPAARVNGRGGEGKAERGAT